MYACMCACVHACIHACMAAPARERSSASSAWHTGREGEIMEERRERADDRSDGQLLRTVSMLFEHIEGQINLADTKAQLTVAADTLFRAATTTLGRGVLGDVLNGSA